MTAWQAVVRTDKASADPVRAAAVPAGLLSGLAGVSPQRSAASVVSPWLDRIVAAFRWLEQKRTQQFGVRRMRVAETVSLGEKRSVSILQVDGAQFLIGSSAQSVQLLAVLEAPSGGLKTESSL